MLDAFVSRTAPLVGHRYLIQGCCHAELDAIYGTVQEADLQSGKRTDLLLICGDFQAIRNEADLSCLAVPQKYRQLGEFHKYYNGDRTAPLLTIIIGGNHEASNYMWELYHGGWVAPNIYYLGCAGSILVNGLRISGASGIFKAHDYLRGHFERMPYDNSTMRSAYHIREYDVFRLSQLRLSRPDIFLSHDWPLGIEKHGDLGGLLRAKPFFAEEVRDNRLGSPPLLTLLRALQPPMWFAAHLHVRFAALYKHDDPGSTLVRGQRVDVNQIPPQPLQSYQRNANEVPLGIRRPMQAADAVLADKAGDLLSNPEEIEIDLDLADQPDAAIDESVDVKAGQELAAVATDGEISLDLEEEDRQPGMSSGGADGAAETLVTATSAVVNPDEIDLGLSDDDAEASPVPSSSTKAPPATKLQTSQTRFLALSKCLPGKDFLQILDFEAPSSDESIRATLDPIWLAITRAFHPYLSLDYQPRNPLPSDENVIHGLINRELAWIRANVRDKGQISLEEAQQFVKTAPAPGDPGGKQRGPPPWYTNPQTEAFCALLGIENVINPSPPPIPTTERNGTQDVYK